MDLDLSSVGLPAVTGICAGIAVFTVWFISKLRGALYKRWKATTRTPGWVWFALALAIPVAVCLLFNLDWFQALIDTAAGDGKLSVSLDGYGAIPTGVMTAIGSNGSFELLRKKGLVTTKPSDDEPLIIENLPRPTAGEPDVQNDASPAVTAEPAPRRTALLLQEIHFPTNGPIYHVWTGQELLLVQTDQEKDT